MCVVGGVGGPSARRVLVGGGSAAAARCACSDGCSALRTRVDRAEDRRGPALTRDLVRRRIQRIGRNVTSAQPSSSVGVSRRHADTGMATSCQQGPTITSRGGGRYPLSCANAGAALGVEPGPTHYEYAEPRYHCAPGVHWCTSRCSSCSESDTGDLHWRPRRRPGQIKTVAEINHRPPEAIFNRRLLEHQHSGLGVCCPRVLVALEAAAGDYTPDPGARPDSGSSPRRLGRAPIGPHST